MYTLQCGRDNEEITIEQISMMMKV